MFTGLVQSLGTITQIKKDRSDGLVLTVKDPMSPSLAIGESVAVNGCCLTVVKKTETDFTFELGPETLENTAFGSMKLKGRVNLERAVVVGDRFGGHIVSGHVDAVGKLTDVTFDGDWTFLGFSVPKAFDELMIEKGSIAIDGISLTLVDVEPGRASVMVIPHTKNVTTLGFKRIGDPVHLEFDLIAKHVKKLYATHSGKK